MKAVDLHITGLVQGVGFRPFIHRLATSLNLCGTVQNGPAGVRIHIEGTTEKIAAFRRRLQPESPPASRIEEVTVLPAENAGFSEFAIVSSGTGAVTTRISPDLAVCEECLADMEEPGRRKDYAFTNCTNCGPRFSIVLSLPYDRAKTTMTEFVMCDACQSEYGDVRDRRFHAQPVACDDCGPSYTLVPPAGETTSGEAITDVDEVLSGLSHLLESGAIVAMRGIGGFHLACDATNNEAVLRLRSGKRREAKPFAVMFQDLDTVREYAEVSKTEAAELSSMARPIVLLSRPSAEPTPGDRGGQDDPPYQPLAESVTQGLSTIGAVLPYLPLHHLFFARTSLRVIVLTSGNLSDEPIVRNNREAQSRLGGVADSFLLHNREIHNRVDDSVRMVVSEVPRMVRRARGYVPNPIRLGVDAGGILAVGAELKNALCVGRGEEAFLSQHIGNLDSAEVMEFFEEVVERIPMLLDTIPQMIVRDLHPDYLSSIYADQSGLPTVSVQHHHAHIASCLAENLQVDPVIGFAFDGTGYGPDDAIWGGEVLVCDLHDYERVSHFAYVPMPGGDLAIREPWRMALAYLRSAFGDAWPERVLPPQAAAGEAGLVATIGAIEKGINCPATSSAGRLFDAVSSIIGLCQHSRFEAEAPMLLESVIERGVDDHYPAEIDGTVSFHSTIEAIVGDLMSGIDRGLISARFHNTIVDVIVELAQGIRSERGLDRVALSGGLFQNRYVLGRSERRLGEAGFTVFTQKEVPSNDGGIALGQLAVAAWRRSYVSGNTG